MTRRKLEKSLQNLGLQRQSRRDHIPAVLGVSFGGVRYVDVPNRPGYVYARIRNNLSEVVQVFNDAVVPAYDLQVLIDRDAVVKSRYKIVARDFGIYPSGWGTTDPYLALHHSTHEFNPDNPGGDIVWVYPQQLLPLLAYPGDTGTVKIHPYTYNYNNNWYYVGNTGTASLISYNPTGTNTNKSVLVYNDLDGNPKLLGGSEFSSSYTGTVQIVPYIPDLPNDCLFPIAAVRLATGTTSITWSNLYDVRPFFGSSSNSTTFNGSLLIYDDSVFKVTGTAIDFGDNLDVAVTGTYVYVTAVGVTGSAGATGPAGASGDNTLLLYEDSVFKVTGTAINFTDIVDIAVSGTVAHVSANHVNTQLYFGNEASMYGTVDDDVTLRSINTNKDTKLLIQPNGNPGTGDTSIHMYHDRVEEGSAHERFFGMGASHGVPEYLFGTGDATGHGLPLDIQFFTENGATRKDVMRLDASGWMVFLEHFDVQEVSAPASPAANVARVYARDDSGTTKLYYKRSDGTEIELGAADEKAKVSSNDTTAGYLNGKLVAGTGVTLTENNNGGDETLTIASTIPASPATYPAIYDDGVFKTTGTSISFNNNLVVTNTGTAVYVSSPITTYQRVAQPLPLTSVTGTTWVVPDYVYASGSLAVFQNGLILAPVVDFQEAVWVSGTYSLSRAYSTGTVFVAMYGVPCVPQAYIVTGVPVTINYLLDSNNDLLLDSSGIQLLDSNG